MDFIHNDFLLQSQAAKRLYHEYAASEPILDFHSHLPPSDIVRDRQFQNLFEIWLEGDHYKWRAMRANGVDERYCTGSAAPYDKFLAWARTVPATLRNPLYHWSHLELKRYFEISDLLNEGNARSVWDRANALLSSPELSTGGILRKFRVQVVCTSDDPCDDLSTHHAINSSDRGFRVYPTFRPDRALGVNSPDVFNTWLGKLQRASNMEISSLPRFLDALKQRHQAFHDVGARLSDHGLTYCFASPCTESQAAAIFKNALSGKPATESEHEQFAAFMMLFFGRLDAEKGWAKQLHLGALRNANSRRLRELGPDSGFDTVGDWNQAERLCSFLSQLDVENSLPKMIVYNINPADDYVFSTALGSFQDGVIAGKVQFGSAWWFLDQKEAIEWQLNALSSTGLLSRFIGMLTDSRSFMSFPRHEYFRRVLCNLVGSDMERGELPNDEKLVGGMIRNICFENARQFLGLELPAATQSPRQTVNAF